MNKYKLSVIIPHYNIPELLSKLLDSIPNCEDIQIIVVDDNSTKYVEELNSVIDKNSYRILEFYRNYTGKNSAGTCRNVGLEHAKGKWVIFADSDDYFAEGWFNTVNRFFESESDIVYFMPTSVVLDTGLQGTRHKMYSDKVEAYLANPSHENEILLRYAFPAPWSKMYKRSHIENNNLRFQPVRMCDDEMFSVQCGHVAKEIECCEENIYVVTCRKGSLTTVVSDEFYDIKQRVYINKYAFFYNNLSKEDIHTLEMDFMPLYTIYDTVASGHSIKLAFEYWKMLRELQVPLVNKEYVKPFKLIKRLVKSLFLRVKKKYVRDKSGL